jgi:PAS domain S-box-containing protein
MASTFPGVARKAQGMIATMSADRESTEFVASFGALSRELMAGMLDQSGDCVKILDSGGRIDFMNSNGRCIMEIDDFSTIAGRAWDSMWPDESSGQIRVAISDAQAGTASRFEAFCPTAKGTPRWWEVTVTPVSKPGGDPFAIMAVSRDVTERRRASESLETMAQEMRHRLRNAFAVSSAIALTSARDEPVHRVFAETLAHRYNALSLVQSKLIEAGPGYSLGTLVREIIDGFDPGAGHIAVGSLPELALSDEQVRFVALVLGELSTNSIKHGALKSGLGIAIEASVSDETVMLDWHEKLSGARPEVPAGSGGGSGHGLMQRMARAHGATLTVTQGDDRLDARLPGFARGC